MKITYGPIDTARKLIFSYKESNPNSTIIDIGGTTSGWSKQIVDLVVDIIAPSDDKNLSFDICVESQWKPLLDIVNEKEKFDLCICTHTLEDLYNPITVLEMMPKIAKSGYISMPSFANELSHREADEYYGYFHHRWLFKENENRMLIIPKLESIRSFIKSQTCLPDEEEICFFWENTVEYDMFMKNYLGPDKGTVANEYGKLIQSMETEIK